MLLVIILVIKLLAQTKIFDIKKYILNKFQKYFITLFKVDRFYRYLY